MVAEATGRVVGFQEPPLLRLVPLRGWRLAETGYQP